MRRLPTLLLSIVVLFSGLAQAFDLHDESGCADSSGSGFSDSSTPARGDAPNLHASGCCFGSIALTLPVTYSNLTVTTVSITSGAENARPLTWQSDSPERPPRS